MSSSIVHERITKLESRTTKIIQLIDSMVDTLVMLNSRISTLKERIAKLENIEFPFAKADNDNDTDHARKLAKELLEEARSFGKPN
jgi:uncharacterized coiled-coil protein SlyX